MKRSRIAAGVARVPFNDLKRDYELLAEEIDAALLRVARSGWYALGAEHDAFEREFAAYVGCAQGVGVANGTDALEIALRALDCGAGCEVATVANAGGYATTAILHAGATPVYVDVDDGTLTMSADSLRSAIGPATKAVIVTHLYGFLADTAAINAVAHAAGLAVIEDCAQAHGARRGGVMAGGSGDIATFSFYPTKNLGALGDGGMIMCHDEDLAERCRRLRQYGWSAKYRAELPGGRNSRLDEIQAAVLRVKLGHLDAWNGRRREIARAYRNAAANRDIEIVHEAGDDFVAHLCVGRHRHREAWREGLAARGVETGVHYPIPDHVQPAMRAVAFRAAPLPNTERACREVFSLPCYPGLRDDEVAKVCGAIEAREKAQGKSSYAKQN